MNASSDNPTGNPANPDRQPRPAKSSRTGLYATIAVVVILAAAEFGGTYYFGSEAETRLHEMVAAQNAQMKFYGYGDNAITVQSYERSYFSSKAVLKTDFRMLPHGQPVSVEVPVVLQHGPVLLGTGGLGLGAIRMVFETDFVSIFNTMLPQVSPADMGVRLSGDYQFTGIFTLGLFGDYSFTCSAPESKVGVDSPESGMAFTVRPGNVSCSGTISRDFMSQKGRMTVDTGSVDLAAMGGQAAPMPQNLAITLSNLVFDYDLTLDPEDFPSGSYTVSMDELSIGDVNNPKVNVALTGLKGTTTMPKSDGPTFSARGVSSIDRVSIQAPQIPTIELAPIEEEQAINDISKAAVRKYLELIQKISAMAAESDNPEQALENEMSETEMLDAVNEALGYGPDYSMPKLRVAVPDHGEANANFAIGVVEGTQFDPDNPEALLGQVEADLGLHVGRDLAVYFAELGLKMQQPDADPAQITQQAGQIVDQSVASGAPFVKMENGVISSTVSVRNGMVTINDMEPMTFEQLEQMFGGGAEQPAQPGTPPAEPQEPQNPQQ